MNTNSANKYITKKSIPTTATAIATATDYKKLLKDKTNTKDNSKDNKTRDSQIQSKGTPKPKQKQQLKGTTISPLLTSTNIQRSSNCKSIINNIY